MKVFPLGVASIWPALQQEHPLIIPSFKKIYHSGKTVHGILKPIFMIRFEELKIYLMIFLYIVCGENRMQNSSSSCKGIPIFYWWKSKAIYENYSAICVFRIYQILFGGRGKAFNRRHNSLVIKIYISYKENDRPLDVIHYVRQTSQLNIPQNLDRELLTARSNHHNTIFSFSLFFPETNPQKSNLFSDQTDAISSISNMLFST